MSQNTIPRGNKHINDRNIPVDRYDNFLDHLCLESMRSMSHFDDNEIFYDYLKAANTNDLLEFTASLKSNMKSLHKKNSNKPRKREHGKEMKECESKSESEDQTMTQLISLYSSNSNDDEERRKLTKELFEKIVESDGQILNDWEISVHNYKGRNELKTNVITVLEELKKWWRNQEAPK